MDWEQAWKLAHHQRQDKAVYIKWVGDAIASLEEQLVQMKEERKKSRESFRTLEESGILLNKLDNIAKHLDDARIAIEKMTEYKYYGAQKYDTPPQVKSLREFTKSIKRLHQIFIKVHSHLRIQEKDFKSLESIMQSNKESLEQLAGLPNRKSKLSIINPANWITRSRLAEFKMTEPHQVEERLTGMLKELTYIASYLNKDVKIAEADFKYIEMSIVIVNQVGRLIHNNRHVWMREGTHYGQWYCYYKQELEEALQVLARVSKSLEELAEDESFMKALAIKIIPEYR